MSYMQSNIADDDLKKSKLKESFPRLRAKRKRHKASDKCEEYVSSFT